MEELEDYKAIEPTAENVEAMSMKVTEGGIAYKEISVPDFESEEALSAQTQEDVSNLPTKNIKIRVSIVNKRMDEDGETYEEYRYRQSMMNHRINKYLKGGTVVWNSSMLGTYDKKRVEQFLQEQKLKEDEQN